MAISVAGRYLRPRYRRLRRAESEFRPWSRRRRACPVTLQPLGTTEQVGQRAMRRSSSSNNELG
jgi:hypothetical protein